MNSTHLSMSISEENENENVPNNNNNVVHSPCQNQDVQYYRVGYAIPQKKVDTFIQPSLLCYARSHGIHLLPIHLDKPLQEQEQEQGPFHCILHKLYSPDWTQQLLHFQSQHPHVLIVDSPDSIHRLHNRLSMLDVVPLLPPPPFPNLTIGIPTQTVVTGSDSLDQSSITTSMTFPLIAKPLLANGTDTAHQMALVFNSNGLTKVNPPVVLQEFVNHGGVIFKVYVAGRHVKCVKRSSLPDININDNNNNNNDGGIMPFSQISNLPPPPTTATTIEDTDFPPSEFVDFVASELSKALNLHLFNFDMIRDANLPTSYLIIDINYFPGYAKVPAFEIMLTNFLLDVLTPKHSRLGGAAQVDGNSLVDDISDPRKDD